MSCRKCGAPTAHAMNCPFLAKPRFRYSKIAKAIEKIKKGIKCPDFNDVCNKPMLPNSTIGRFCKDNPELAFYTGFEMAVLQCGEILAKAQSDDK